MPLPFHKMHGAGNDFVLIDARGKTFSLEPPHAVHIADRHRGIGCDQILVLREARGDCLARYEIWNADGSPAATLASLRAFRASFRVRRAARTSPPDAIASRNAARASSTRSTRAGS